MEGLEVNVLGISGAHRKGRNTSFLVQEALRSAEKVPGVRTRFLELADYRIGYCTHCNHCLFPADDPQRKTGGGCILQDDMQQIYPMLDEADGIILGSPVYVSNVSARMKVFLDRLRPVAFKGSMAFKVGGAISVALLPFGGQEVANTVMLSALHILEGITVTGMATGGAGYSGPPLGPRGSEDDGVNIAVKNDTYAMTSAMMVGRKVAEVAKLIKAGIRALGPEFMEMCSVYHFPLKPEEWRNWDIKLV